MRTHNRKTGDAFKTNQGCIVYIVEYISPREVVVEFREPVNYQFTSSIQTLSSGAIRNRYLKTMSGVGFLGFGEHSWTTSPKAHKLLSAVLGRCYLGTERNYLDCTTVDEWHNFQNFATWCNYQKGFNLPGWELDKDILVKGNRVYGPDTCCFVPLEINSLFVLKRGFRGSSPIGVSQNKWGRFKASCSHRGKAGAWNGPLRATAEEAFYDYKKYKEMVIRERADEFKDMLDPKVYDALYNYQIEITD